MTDRLRAVFIVFLMLTTFAAAQTIGAIDFNGDTPGQPPATGGPNQPTSFVAFPGTTVLVQSTANGIDTQPVAITADAPGQFASVNFEFPPISSGVVRIEATVAFNRLVDCFFLQSGVSAFSAVVSRLIATSAGEIQDDATRTTVGSYVANQPFRVRMDLDMTAKSWSAAIDNELNGFDDDAVTSNLPFENPLWALPYVGAVDASLSVFPTTTIGASVAYDDITVVVPGTPVTLVQIDIKPGSFPNTINLGSAGNVPVAILSSPTFNAPAEVDPSTVTLAGAGVRLLGKGDRYSCTAQETNGDGLIDLVCHVLTEHFLTEPGESVAVLEAKTFGGTPIRGEDSIQIVP
jgi:hypothetical protein